MSTTPTVTGPDGIKPGTKMLNGLTGLRFPIAIGIFLIHATHVYNPANYELPVTFLADQDLAMKVSEFLIPIGLPFLSFFFMLSGFVLTWGTKPGEKARKFWRRRFFRVFPNHIVMYVLAVLLIAGATVNWLPNLLLVNTWNINEPGGGTNIITWSMCAEVLFYALFPFLVVPIRKIPAKWLWTAAAAAAGGIVAINLFAMNYFTDPVMPGNILPISPNQMWFAALFPPSRLFEFIVGMILARIVMSGRWPHIKALPIALVWLASAVVAQYVDVPWTFSLVAMIPNAMILCAVASADVRGVRSILTSKVMMWGGNLSYSFFMVQTVVVYWGRTQFTGTYDVLPAIGMWFLSLLVTLFAAWVLYTLVEAPMMRKFSRARPKPQPAVAPAAEDRKDGATVQT